MVCAVCLQFITCSVSSSAERGIAGAVWKRAAFLQMLKNGLGRNLGEEAGTAPSQQAAPQICLGRGFDSAAWSRWLETVT